MKGETRVMTGKLKKLKILGIIYFICGVAGGINLFARIMMGSYNAISLVESDIMNEKFASLFLGADLLVSSLVALAHIYIGIKGYEYGIGIGYGYFHVGISRLLPIAMLLQLAGCVVMIFADKIDYVSIVTSVIGLIIIYNYNKCARIALES